MPEEVAAHVQFMRDWADDMRSRGESRGRPGAGSRGHLRPVRRRGPPARDRRPVPGDQGG
ncbi:hypothetical protein [Nocardioides convexus]|uniref:hypothetical protein n=1 Tax=Nocardioides convexus TaxID=2712224 RepID=UPI00241865F9|nr:hypothetical protein [Nocardioides convexus]